MLKQSENLMPSSLNYPFCLYSLPCAKCCSGPPLLKFSISTCAPVPLLAPQSCGHGPAGCHALPAHPSLS